MTLPLPHLTALLLSYGYVGALLLGAELLRRGGKTSPDTARKIVHAGVGLWVVPTVFVFSDWRVAIVPPVTFVVSELRHPPLPAAARTRRRPGEPGHGVLPHLLRHAARRLLPARSPE